MRILAIETATEACSVALFDEDVLIDARHEVLGRGHAERLVPLIAELPGKGLAEEIRVSLGPGSFTGTRIGLATARALGVAWSAQVRGYPTLALVAAMAQAMHPGPVSVCMTGGHGEWFAQDFGIDGLPCGDHTSLKPAAVAARPLHPTLAGSQARGLADRIGREHIALDLLPDARFAMLLNSKLLNEDLTVVYGRPPDARIPS